MTMAARGQSDFTRFWTGETATVLAYQFMIVAIGWQIYDLTSSALDLGLVGLAHFCAQIVFSLPAGHYADRHDRRRIASACQLVKGGIAFTLAVGSHAGWINDVAIYACTFVIGAASTIQAPSLRAMLPGLVGDGDFPRSLAWSAAARKAAVIVGPALGGFIYILGPEFVYAVSALLFGIGGGIIYGIRLGRAARATQEPVTLRYMFGGVSYIRRHPVLLGSITLDLFATLLGGATALLPIYARDILQTGPWGLGLLRAAPAIGAVVASAYLFHRPLTHNVGCIMLACIAIFGTLTVVFGLSTWLPLSLAALTILGAADMVSVVIRSALIQLDTPDEMRGRVSAVNSLCTGTSNQLGQFESGLTAAWWGPVASVVVGGLGAVIVALLWIRLFPALTERQALVERRDGRTH